MSAREDLAALVRCVTKGLASIVPIMDGMVEVRIDGIRWQTFLDRDGIPEINSGIRSALERAERVMPKPSPQAAPAPERSRIPRQYQPAPAPVGAVVDIKT